MIAILSAIPVLEFCQLCMRIICTKLIATAITQKQVPTEPEPRKRQVSQLVSLYSIWIHDAVQQKGGADGSTQITLDHPKCGVWSSLDERFSRKKARPGFIYVYTTHKTVYNTHFVFFCLHVISVCFIPVECWRHSCFCAFVLTIASLLFLILPYLLEL